MPVRALTELPDEWKCVFPVLSWTQDWNTGRPAQANTPGADVRWIPKHLSERQVLVMCYLPDEGPYWKKERRLRPGMVCLADGWEALAALAEQQKEKKKNRKK